MNFKKILYSSVLLLAFTTTSFASDSDSAIDKKDMIRIFGQSEIATQIERLNQKALTDTKGGTECRIIYDRTTGSAFQICR